MMSFLSHIWNYQRLRRRKTRIANMLIARKIVGYNNAGNVYEYGTGSVRTPKDTGELYRDFITPAMHGIKDDYPVIGIKLEVADDGAMAVQMTNKDSRGKVMFWTLDELHDIANGYDGGWMGLFKAIRRGAHDFVENRPGSSARTVSIYDLDRAITKRADGASKT